MPSEHRMVKQWDPIWLKLADVLVIARRARRTSSRASRRRGRRPEFEAKARTLVAQVLRSRSSCPLAYSRRNTLTSDLLEPLPWPIRHDDGFGTLDEHESGVANEGHAGGAREPLLQHAHLGAIAGDRQLGEPSLLLGLDQLRGPAVRNPSGRVSGIDVSIGTIAPALPSAFTGMRKSLPVKKCSRTATRRRGRRDRR